MRQFQILNLSALFICSNKMIRASSKLRSHLKSKSQRKRKFLLITDTKVPCFLMIAGIAIVFVYASFSTNSFPRCIGHYTECDVRLNTKPVLCIWNRPITIKAKSYLRNRCRIYTKSL